MLKKEKSTFKSRLLHRINHAPVQTVWTPVDFIDLGGRTLVDKTLQRLTIDGTFRRIDRGLYDCPKINTLTNKPTAPDYRQVIDAVGRRDQIRILIDGITAANDLGLTHAVPARVVVHTDGRLKPIKLESLTIQFKLTAPSKLYWAGRPAMRIVQSLYWLRDGLKNGDEINQGEIKSKLIGFLKNSSQGKKICDDLESGLHAVPLWMRQWIQALLDDLKKELDKNKR